MVLQPFFSVVKTYREQAKGKNDDTIILRQVKNLLLTSCKIMISGL